MAWRAARDDAAVLLDELVANDTYAFDAFVPDEGENVFQILGGSGSAFDIPDPTAVFDIVGYPGAPEGDAEAFLKPDTVHNSFAQDLPEADRWLIAAGQRPITLGANTTPSGPAA